MDVIFKVINFIIRFYTGIYKCFGEFVMNTRRVAIAVLNIKIPDSVSFFKLLIYKRVILKKKRL
jgi:hypothetical protein